MAVITTNLACDLKEVVKVEYLSGNLFSQDNQANVINVTVLDGGEPASISGTVSANIIRQDGGTVAATGGTITDNVVSITLPAAAYSIPGVVSIVVKLTSSGVITTLAAVVANVYQSSTETAIDPGTIIPSVTSLVSQIETAVASIPADYSALWTSLAPAFNSSSSYVAGQYVTYNGGLYRFTTTHSGSWAAGDVVAVNVGGELADIKSAFINECVIQNEKVLGNSNLLEDITWTTGKYINDDGDVYDNQYGQVSSKIQIIEPYTYIFYSFNTENYRAHKIAMYDSNDTYLGKTEKTTENGIDYLIIRTNETVSYLRIATSINSTPILFSKVNAINDEQIKNGLQVRSLLEYNSVFAGIDNQGEIAGSSNNRCTTYNKIKNVAIIIPGSNIEISFYAFDKNGEPLGFYHLPSLSTSTVTWTKSPIILSALSYYNQIGSIRVYCKTSSGTFTDYRDCRRVSIVLFGNWYEQKKWYAIGDSITYGTFSKIGGSIERSTDLNYAIQCARMLNYNLTNYGVPNLGFTVNATDQSFTDQTIVDVMTNHAYTDAELVTIALGTNDYGRDGELGQLSDDSSTVSVYGRMKYIISTLKTKCPKARIIFFTPIPRETSGSLATQFSKLSPNSKGFTLNDVKQAIIDVCEYYGIEYFNLLDNFVLNYANYETYQKDNLHPTIQGHTVMAKAIASKLI